MAYIPQSGSVVAFQSDGTKLLVDASVAGTVGASIIGYPNVNVGGSVVTFQGTSPWVVAPNNSSVITVSSGSIATVIIGGSIAASFTPPANQSVSGTVQTDVRGSVATVIIGGSIAASFTPPANQSVSGTVQTDVRSSVAVAIISGSIAATFTPPANQSVSGTVQTDVRGSVATVIIGGSIAASFTPPANQSVSGTVNIGTQSGSVVAFQGTTPWLIGSVYGNISGSVAATITNTNVNVSGSVVGFQGGTWSPSAIGYIERNDAVASFLGADLTYRPMAGDSAGRVYIKPFAADESRLDTTSSVTSTSVTALFTSVTGLRNYVTDIMIANTGSVATLVTFKDGSTSILGMTIAPAGGGSNINGMMFPMRTAPAQDFVYTAATASSVLYVTAKGYKAP